MKYSCEVIIDKPIAEVIEKFDRSDMSTWQPGFVSMELISGQEKAEGSKYVLKYKMKKREMELTETIVKFDLPREFTAIYESGKVWNENQNLFSEVDGKTKYISNNEFRLGGFMKFFGWIMPGMFKKQTLSYMNNFKRWVETGETIK